MVCASDSVAPAGAAIETARRIGASAKLRQYDCGYFDIYVGGGFERSVGDPLEFFGRVLAPAGRAV